MLWQISQNKSAEKGFPSSLHFAVTRGKSKYNEADVSVFPPAPTPLRAFTDLCRDQNFIFSD